MSSRLVDTSPIVSSEFMSSFIIQANLIGPGHPQIESLQLFSNCAWHTSTLIYEPAFQSNSQSSKKATQLFASGLIMFHAYFFV